MKSLHDISAPAKLNLFLHIVGQRADGYHLLESVFMLIDWCDTLHFECREDGVISREDLTVPLPTDDLVVRAARALQKISGSTLGAHIGVEKRIPSQAGMGGGSSDAASTLLALNRLWNLNLGLETLLPLGLTLGADVPFFLRGQNAWVSGIGENITPVNIPSVQFLVAKPHQGIETGRIFSHPELKRNTNPSTIFDFAPDTFGFGRNDLQPVAQLLCPGIAKALDWFDELGLQGRMTGSGSAVFALAPQPISCTGVDEFEVKQCHNLQVHPLLGWA